MKKLLFTLLFSTVCFLSFSQKSKSKTIYSNSLYNYYIYEFKHYDALDTLVSQNFVITARNYQYKSIVDLFELHDGTIDENYDFLNFCLNFFNKEESGTSTTFHENSIHVYQVMGAKYLSVYGKEKESNSYAQLNASQIKKMLNALETYAQKNNLLITKEIE